MIIDPDYRNVGEAVVTLQMSESQAKQIQDAISDLLCWSNGFMAAKGEDFRFGPMGVDTIRELRIALKSAIRKATK